MRLATALVATFLGASLSGAAAGRPSGGTAVALVTAETENALLAVSLPPQRVLRRVRVPADPQNVAVLGNSAVIVVSTASHAVTVLSPQLEVVRIFRGFQAPHLAAIAPDGEWAYVTDDASGRLAVIELTRPRIVARVRVGVGAHHLTFSSDGNRAWIALGERARTIVELDTVQPSRPRVIGRFDPGFFAHDLSFSPDDRRVWVTSDADSRVRVFAAATHRVLFTVPVGPPPQHVAFGARGVAFVTSGYGSRIVAVAGNGHVLRSATVPYGSFNVATSGSLVVTSSLLRGTVTEFNENLRRMGTAKVAPAARGVELVLW